MNVHQTEELAAVKSAIATWKALDLGFLENININTQTVLGFFPIS